MHTYLQGLCPCWVACVLNISPYTPTMPANDTHYCSLGGVSVCMYVCVYMYACMYVCMNPVCACICSMYICMYCVVCTLAYVCMYTLMPTNDTHDCTFGRVSVCM